MFCINCGSELETNARYCEYCGADLSGEHQNQGNRQNREAQRKETTITRTQVYYTPNNNSSYSPHDQVSPKSRLVLIILWFFFGVFGVHYFYAGRVGIGILWLITGGFFGIGWIIDIIVILTGTFKDSHGRPIVRL